MSCPVLLKSGLKKDQPCGKPSKFGMYCGVHKSKNTESDSQGSTSDEIKPSAEERQLNSEVTTPPMLRKMMLDTLPLEFWSQPRKVLEPCSGKGGFLLDIIERFQEGLKDKYSDEERERAILEECIHFADINASNIEICKKLIDKQGKYKLNAYIGDTLRMEFPMETTCFQKKPGFDIQFDAVIANPPYTIGSSARDMKNLYNLFVEKFIDHCQFMLYVIPSRWFVGSKGLDGFREMMRKRKDIRLIQHQDNATEWFGNTVDIRGGVCFFLIDKTFKGNCLFNGVEYDLGKYDVILKPEYHSIIDRTSNSRSLIDIYRPGSFYGYTTNDERLEKESREGSTKCYVSLKQSKDRIRYVNDFKPTSDKCFWKVVTMSSSGKEFDGFGEMFISSPDEIYNDSHIAFAVNDEKEAKSLLSYLRTEFANHMLSIAKVSHFISKKTCKQVPLVPLDREWTDKSVEVYWNESTLERSSK